MNKSKKEIRKQLIVQDTTLPRTEAIKLFNEDFEAVVGVRPHQFIREASRVSDASSDFTEWQLGQYALFTYPDGAHLELIVAGPSVPSMQPWVPEADPVILRRLGKTAEELFELGKVIARIVIQGLDGADPEDGKPNTIALQEEIADVYAQLDECVEKMPFMRAEAIAGRRARKRAMMDDWESHFEESAPRCDNVSVVTGENPAPLG